MTGAAATLLALLGLLAIGAAGTGCESTPRTPPPPPPPIDEGMALADDVMTRLGGQEAWDETRFITFTFFGRRRHAWDRYTGDIRIEGTDRASGTAYVTLMNVHDREGASWQDGTPITDAARADEMLESAYRAWVNDTYWLVMPFKLRDPGVTLARLEPAEMTDGRMADVLELTFDGVGVTPENKYHVYVARDSGLVEQWDFYATADDAESRFQIPWHGWRRHGSIMLSGDRGESQLTNIGVYEQLPRAIFTDPAARIPELR
jgi:hypothetical protein